MYGALAGMAMTVAGFVGVILVAEDRQDRADSGDAVYERRGPNTTLAVLVVPVLLGAAAFVGVFTATGGKLSAEHARALRR